MTSDALPYYQQTRLAQTQRLRRLITEYVDDLNPLGQRLLARALVAVTGDYVDAMGYGTPGPHNISSAPPPPAEPSPEGSP